jgi:hypothetical protein
MMVIFIKRLNRRTYEETTYVRQDKLLIFKDTITLLHDKLQEGALACILQLCYLLYLRVGYKRHDQQKD